MANAADLSSAPAYREFDVVATRAAVWAEDNIYPSGTLGTIVFVHKSGDAFEVEFTNPAPAVVTLEAGDLGEVQWRA